MNEQELKKLVDKLRGETTETEWLEFKHNFHSPEEIGERISAIANSCCLLEKKEGYLVYGVENKTHKVLGTNFNLKSQKKGNENLENWILNYLSPKIDFSFHRFEYSPNIFISLFIIPATKNEPVCFNKTSYIRIGSYTRKLNEFPEKARKIWNNSNKVIFEKEIAKKNVDASKIVELLNTQAYFELLKIPYPSTQKEVISKFITENLIKKNRVDFDITKLGVILLAKNLDNFEEVRYKAVRVIIYKEKNKTKTIREYFMKKGYAIGFEELIIWINSQLPANEKIGKALREEKRMYPEISIRELVANALIHQDFFQKGYPMIEVFSDRIEITNSGIPLIETNRFIDYNRSRNEKLVNIMRRFGICEEKGSGMDKIIEANELYRLPAINFRNSEKHMTVILYSYKTLRELDKNDKIRACYQHACLKQVSNDKMTNKSLRERFNIEKHNYSTASRIIKDTIKIGLIKEDEKNSKKYLPFWG